MFLRFQKYFFELSAAEKISLTLRIIAATAGIIQLVFGEKGIGFATLVLVAAITVPQVATRGNIKSLPIEFELIFVTMVILQLVVGETLDFYNNVPYYDKFVHFSIPFFVGFMGFIAAYTLDQTGKLSISTIVLTFIIIFFTLGVGALWEIIEYTSDQFIDPLLPSISQLQGSSVERPIDDTMRDLILDFLGGIFGAVLGLRFIRHAPRSTKRKARLRKLVKNLAVNFSKKKTKRM